jgi:hypothetical protein
MLPITIPAMAPEDSDWEVVFCGCAFDVEFDPVVAALDSAKEEPVVDVAEETVVLCAARSLDWKFSWNMGAYSTTVSTVAATCVDAADAPVLATVSVMVAVKGDSTVFAVLTRTLPEQVPVVTVVVVDAAATHVFPLALVHWKPLREGGPHISHELEGSLPHHCWASSFMYNLRRTTAYGRLPCPEHELYVPVLQPAGHRRARGCVTSRTRQPRRVVAPSDKRPMRRADGARGRRPARDIIVGNAGRSAALDRAALAPEPLRAVGGAVGHEHAAANRQRPRRGERAEKRAGLVGEAQAHREKAGK